MPEMPEGTLPTYWILDVSDCQAYILRHPTASTYQSETCLDDSALLTPLAFSELEIPLSEFLLPL